MSRCRGGDSAIVTTGGPSRAPDHDELANNEDAEKDEDTDGKVPLALLAKSPLR
jgi:hypothetical protein